ncbi:MAG: lipase family alpha/beta hydrolase [Jatrophihabitans sp.]
MLRSLSPARRRLVLVTGAVVVVLVAGLLVRVVTNRGDKVDAAPQGDAGPVLLVPGYGGSTTALSKLAGVLRGKGRDATVVSLPGGGTGDLKAQAKVLGTAVTRARSRTGARSVDLIGYSAGGVVARLWVRDGGASQVRRVVTLGSPQHGTDLASLAGSALPDACPTACQQLATDSDLLRTLNAGDETPAGPVFVSIWSSVDQIVEPPDSAKLAGATNIVIQDVCAGSQVAHGQLPTDPVVTAMVVAELGTGAVRSFAASDCASLSS